MWKDQINVVIPCYNSEKYISRCLESILKNTYQNIKIICVDDGSTDNTPNIIRSYTENNNVILINKENGGPSSARNAALDSIDLATGYITFVDSDDFVDKDYFYTLISLSKKYNADIICSKIDYFNGKTDYKASILDVNNETILDSYKALLELFADEKLTSLPFKFFKSYLWNDIRFPNKVFFLEDLATIFRIFIKSNVIVLSGYCGYHYNQCNTESIMRRQISNDKILSGWEALKYVNDYEFCCFNTNQKKALKHKTINLFMDNFLELYPRYDLSNKKEELNYYLCYVKKNHLAFHFKPKKVKQFIKKYSFLIFPKLYHRLFNYYIGHKYKERV